MSFTVDNVQARVASILDQDQDTSNISSTDYALRLSYINERERMWAESGKWEALVKEYNTRTSAISGNTSISLPADFRYLSSFPVITYDGVSTKEFTQIRPNEENQFDQASSHFVKILGNPNSGYTMVINPGTANRQLASGASIKVLYYSIPTSHASPANVIFCTNPEYVVKGVIADVWEAREDARFQQAKAEANIILQNLLEGENTPSEASYGRTVKTIEQTRFNYRWGR